MGRIHMALRSYSVLDILLPPTIIIIQECSQALKTCKRLSSLSCGGVSNMLLVLSITSVVKIYGIVYVQLTHFSSGDWKDIFIAHVIIIIKSEVSTFTIVIIFFRGRVSEMFVASYSACIAYTFRENCFFVFIIIVQFMISANSRIRYGPQIVFVCLYITPSHYHHCANLSADIELKCLPDIFCQVCE